MKKYFAVLGIVVLGALGGCAAYPATNPYVPIALPVRSDVRGVDSAVRRLPTAPEEPLSLEAVIRIAVANNPDLAAGAFDVAAAEHRISASRSAVWPVLTAEGGYQKFLDNQRLIAARYNGEPGIFDDDISRGDLVVRLPLYTGGRVKNEIDASELIAASESLRLSRSRDELLFNVSSLYYGILSQKDVISSISESIEIMRKHSEKISDMVDAQKSAPVDKMRTDVRIAELQQIMIREQNMLSIEERALLSAMGFADGKVRLSGRMVPEDASHNSTDEYVRKALVQREDYLSAKAKLEAQAKKVDIVRAGALPQVFAQASYGTRQAGKTESDEVGFAGVGISIPLFDGGLVAAQVQQERALLGAAQERLRKMELQIRQDIEAAVATLEASNNQLVVSGKAVSLASESLRIEQLKYGMGRGTILDVLDAQATLLQSRTNMTRAMSDLHISKARLALATGEALQ